MKIKHFISIIGLSIAISCYASPLQWRTLAPGMQYTKINPYGGFSGLHIFRFDLQHYQLKLAFTQDTQSFPTSIYNLVRKNNAVIGVNGGFFTPDLKPLGLRMNNGEVKNPIKPTVWWGVFYTQSGRAYVVPQRAFRPSKSIDFAVQSGPRLIVNGNIPSLKPGVANRTALGITRSGEIILLVTNGSPLSMDELAHIMLRPESRGGLDCVNALNLDGGSSTQLYANLDDFSLNVPSFAPVTDAVLVVPKNNN